MIFYGSTTNGNQIFVVDLTTKAIQQITNKSGNKSGEIVGRKTRKVYFRIKDSIFSPHIDTHKIEFVCKFPEDEIGSVATLSASETLLGGVLSSKENRRFSKIIR